MQVIKILATIFIFFLSFSQNIEVEKQIMLPKSSNAPLGFEYNKTEKSLYVLRYAYKHTSRYIELDKYDTELQKIWTIRLAEKPRSIEFIALKPLGKYIWIFWQTRREQKVILLYSLYDTEGNILNEYEVFQEFGQDFIRNRKLLTVSSLNRKLFAIINGEMGGDGRLNTKEKISVAYFKLNDKEIYYDEININYPDEYLQLLDAELTNNNNLYLLFNLYTKPSTKIGNLKEVVVYRRILGSDVLINVPVYKVDTSNIRIRDLILRATKDNYIIVGGFYTNNIGARGTVFYKLSPYSNSILEKNTSEFPVDILKVYLSSGAISRGKGIDNLYLDNIIPRSDGGVVIIGEEFYVTYRTYRDMYNNWIDEVIYNYGDIIVSSISAEGELEWIRRIPKYQAGSVKYNLSYNCFVSPTNLCFLYEAVKTKIGKNVYYSLISPSGERKPAFPLFANYRRAYVYLRSMSKQITPKSAIILLRDTGKKNIILAKIKLPS